MLYGSELDRCINTIDPNAEWQRYSLDTQCQSDPSRIALEWHRLGLLGVGVFYLKNLIH